MHAAAILVKRGHLNSNSAMKVKKKKEKKALPNVGTRLNSALVIVIIMGKNIKYMVY